MMQVGGPSWTVKLGRRDSTIASKSLANSDLPKFTDDLTTLITHFTNKGLTLKDMVTLSGKFITNPFVSNMHIFIFVYMTNL